MKVYPNELPLMKSQTRRKTPKIAPPLIALALLLLTIIPIYYPFLRYTSKNSSSQEQHPSSFSQVPLSDPLCEDESGHCNSHNNNNKQDNIENNLPQTTTTLQNNLSSTTEEAVHHHHRDVETLLRNQDSAATLTKPDQSVNRDVETKRRKRRNRKKVTAETRKREVARTSSSSTTTTNIPRNYVDSNCDIFSGEWVINPEGPYYTNSTCFFIQEHQNCLKFGKPGEEYLKWRWKPLGCALPVFDPFQFLEIMRGKSLAFVGDSVARNHMQSLICLLSGVEEPVDVSEIPYGSQFKRYEYRNHNFTIEIFWSPYLVKTTQTDPADGSRPFNLFLDEFDERWTTKIEDFDYVIISAGHWFFRPTMFYLNGRIAGCLYCPQSNITHLNSYFSYRRAFRTAFRAINSLENYKGLTFLRTFAPSHFENGYWDKGGDCVRTRPFGRNETTLEGYNLEFYNIQLEELKIGQRLGRRKGLKYRLFDVTQAMLLRPDGHPSKYGHWPETKVPMANDCVHWCLPGPVDAWNDFFLELLKREEGPQLVL